MNAAIMFWLEIQTGMPVTGIYWLMYSMGAILIFEYWM